MLDEKTRAMVLEWLGPHPTQRRVEQVAKWMRDTLRIGSITECRAMLRDAAGLRNPRRSRSRKGRNGGRARKRRPRMARARQNPRTPKAGALHQFQRWQDRSNARGSWKKLRAPARIPTHMAGLGELVAIEYRSNKYDGKPKVYRHRTKTPRPMLATDPEGRDVFVVGGHMKVTPDGLVN
jgi:hypothetical protein